MNKTRHTALAAAMAVAISAVVHDGARAADASAPATAAPPTSAFFAPEHFLRPALSPDGTSLALLANNAAGRRQLVIADTADLTRLKAISTFGNADIVAVRWLDDKRLMFSVTDEQAAYWDRDSGGRFAIDKDGSNAMLLNGRVVASTFARPRAGMGRVERRLDDGSGNVVVSYWKRKYSEWSDSYPELYDTRKGQSTPILTGQIPLGIQDWLVDGQGHIRAAMGERDAQRFLTVRQPDGTWVERAHLDTYAIGGSDLYVHSIAVDGQAYATQAGSDAARSRGFYRLNLDTGRTDAQPLLNAPGFDIDPELIENQRTHKVVGAHIRTDADSTVWFDPELKALQDKVDALLPGLVNRIDVAECGCAQRVLVTSSSDRQPPLYFLFDRADGKLTPIGSARPDIQARQMAMTDFYRIKARDGLEIPVWVTRPRGKGPFPAVVLVHGGPWVRGWDWAWEPESQFLAAHGYLVVRPEFRGSTGYGGQLFEAGFRQWGLKMQDDVADATRWASAQGLADPKRTCIAGASYGGYATLMGLVRYGDLYQCGVAWAAVTDINLMFDITWSDFPMQYKKYGMPALVGDQDKDAEQFKLTSPIVQAARLTRPLLLAHGGVDHRVPIDHAIKLRRALESRGASVTWIEYTDEGHGWYRPANRVDFYDRMVKFLDAHTGSVAAGQ